MRILHVSPHSDDEALGSPAVLLELARYHQVENLLLGAGSPRRLQEAEAAAKKSDITLIAVDAALSSGEDPATNKLRASRSLPPCQEYDLWISPQPQDAHPVHEAVGAAIRDHLTEGAIWWQWGLWRELARANILHTFGNEEMARCQEVLRCYQGELNRNNFSRLLEGRAKALSILAPERLWGWGSRGSQSPYAEVLLEVQRRFDGWAWRSPRRFDPRAPLRGKGPWQDATNIVNRQL